MNEKQRLSALEAMLFANGEPVAVSRLADAMLADLPETERLLEKLQKNCVKRMLLRKGMLEIMQL